MTSLRSLRVFETQRPVFVDPHGLASKRLITDFERALFPSDTADQPPLSTYELLLPGRTNVTLLTALRSPFIETLRLSGTVQIANTPSATLKNLKHLTINNVQGSYFDTRDFSQDFPSIHTLESFIYSQTDRLSFELRDHHLHTISTAANSLRKLVLINCRKLTTATIAHCLKQFQRLEHFALALVTTLELEVNFIRDTLPPTIRILRLAIQNERWMRVFVDKEGDIYRTVGNLMQETGGVLTEVSLHMRPEFLRDPTWGAWLSNAAHHSCILLTLGPWINSERI
ncbi:hypothetical protein BDM02DRAFT_3112059 [Thelephora ganbajun]|uniref:Uncharacterized protein n=1 Tax=Thelephora ganbajun TaxID=370292 RepID=A0ACB6ZL36_THEGA|nr:hypothetical protein BDM02DRAFT_3112059 [Thelephora ganbajun]